MLCLLLWLVTATLWQGVLPPRAVLRQGPGQVPEQAAQFIRQSNLRGRMFNDYENSSYLQWRLNTPLAATGRVPSKGRHPLFIDVLHAYPRQVMVDYQDILKASKRGRKLLVERRVDYVVLGTRHRKSGLARHLNGAGKREWAQVYNKADAVIWVQRTPNR